MVKYLRQNLKFLRKKKGFIQEDMTKLLGLRSRTLYEAWEQGRSLPQLKDFVSLSELYCVSIDYLVCKDLSKVPKHEILGNYMLIQQELKS